jgi:anthranilate phosphoribosyltransferase
VYKEDLLETVTYVAKQIGYTNAMFVHGVDGLDEISLLGKTKIKHLRNGEVKTYEIQPEDFGLERCKLEAIKSSTPKDNAEVILGVFDGRLKDSNLDAIILNAAGALIVGEKADDFKQGVTLAREIIGSGAAKSKLMELREMSNGFN